MMSKLATLTSIICGVLIGGGLSLPLFDVDGSTGAILAAAGLIGLSFASQSRIARAGFAVIALALSAACIFALIERSPLATWRHDFTEDKLFTLTPGTEKVLQHIDHPVTIRFYTTRQSKQAPQDLKRYTERVDSLLSEYQALAPDKIRIIEYSPEPDTDAAEAASLDGIIPRAFEAGEYFYLGLSISSLDRKVSFPKLDPSAENSLETELSQAIAAVSQPRKFKIGIMSDLYLQGSPNVAPGQSGGQPWYLFEQLSQSFQTEMIPMSSREIPTGIDLLLLIHPAGISKPAEYAIDQFALKGGNVIACLDAFSVEALLANGPVGLRGGGLSSNLPTLLPHWGVGYRSEFSVADPRYRSKLGSGQTNLSLLTLTDHAVVKESPFTANLRDLLFVFPGGFYPLGTSGFDYRPLLEASENAALVDPERAYNFDPTLATEIQAATRKLSDGSTERIRLSLAVELAGTVTTSFPDGPPMVKAPQNEKTKPEPDTIPSVNPTAHKSEGQARIFLISDVDAFGNNTAYRPSKSQGGNTSVAYANDNVTLLLNLIDRLSGSEYLIDARKTVSTRRPFTVFNEIERKFNEQFGAREIAIEDEINKTRLRIAKLQSTETDPDQPFMNPEQEAELARAQSFIAGKQREKRLLRRDLKETIDREENRIFLLNLLIVPGVVSLWAIVFLGIRHRLTSAK